MQKQVVHSRTGPAIFSAKSAEADVVFSKLAFACKKQAPKWLFDCSSILCNDIFVMAQAQKKADNDRKEALDPSMQGHSEKLAFLLRIQCIERRDPTEPKQPAEQIQPF